MDIGVSQERSGQESTSPSSQPSPFGGEGVLNLCVSHLTPNASLPRRYRLTFAIG
jgi:hypothetical protein